MFYSPRYVGYDGICCAGGGQVVTPHGKGRTMQKKTLALWAAATLAASLAVGAPADAAAPSYTDSVAYQVTAKHDGLAGGSALPDGLSRKWSKDLGGTVSYPVIAGGRVFVTVEHTASYGTDLYAFDAQTGAALWGPVDLGGVYFISSLAYNAGRLFAVNYDGLLRGFDPATGTQLWSRQLPGQSSFTSPVTAAGGVVYTGGAGSGGTLYAVDGRTGVANGDDSAPAVNGTAVYVSYACENTYRFDLAGTLVWNHTTGCSGGGGRTPVLHNAKLWVRDDAGETPAVLNTATGEQERTFDSQTAPAFTGNSGVLLQSGTLTGIAAGTGKVRWSQAGDGQLASAPVISGQVAYVGSGSGSGTVFGYDVTTGAQVWSGSAGAPVQGPDEHNAGVLQGLAIGDGVLAVPAGSVLTVFG